MRIWKMSLQRTKRTIISWHGSFKHWSEMTEILLNKTIHPAIILMQTVKTDHTTRLCRLIFAGRKSFFFLIPCSYKECQSTQCTYTTVVSRLAVGWLALDGFPPKNFFVALNIDFLIPVLEASWNRCYAVNKQSPGLKLGGDLGEIITLGAEISP